MLLEAAKKRKSPIFCLCVLCVPLRSLRLFVYNEFNAEAQRTQNCLKSSRGRDSVRAFNCNRSFKSSVWVPHEGRIGKRV